jgi:5-methylcytosine-specific restriction endonuclease McrA
MEGEDVKDIDVAIFDETSPLHGLALDEFRGLEDSHKTMLLRLIARCCEKSCRRGFQQGWDSKERGDKVCDLIKWRFSTSLGISPSPHDTYHSTALERLRIECNLYKVGLKRMESDYLRPEDIQTHIVPLFSRHKKRTGIKKSVRFAVLRRDGFRCVYCGADASEKKLHIDHVMPKSLGGSDDIENLVASCDECNLGKSNRHHDIAERIPNAK